MISEFHELSDKIDRLAELTVSLRRENAHLRHSNALLVADHFACLARVGEAERRLEALLAKMPAPVEAADAAAGDAAPAPSEHHDETAR